MTQPVSIRYNNPGALNTVTWVRAMPGYVGEQTTTPGNSTARFDTMEHGVAVWKELLRRYAEKGARTIANIITTYGGGQDYSAYAQFVQEKTSLPLSTVVDLENSDQLMKLARAMFWYEAGIDSHQWIDDATILRGFGSGKPPLAAIDLGQKIKTAMHVLGYPWFPDQNVVSVEGMDRDGTPNQNRDNAFDDIKMVLDGDGKILFGPVTATTQPGRYFTENPMASGGAFIIALGPQTIWTPGDYHGLTVWRQAEDSFVMGYRDPNMTYKRNGPVIRHENIGIHHHGSYNQSRNDISNAAAGCQVIRMMDDQQAFMDLTMKCPRYKADKKGYRLTATVLTAIQVASPVIPQPAPQPLPAPPPPLPPPLPPPPPPPAPAAPQSWWDWLQNR